jgi:hypothetical protein
MKYTVIIEHDGETARLECSSLAEAQEVRRSFISYGKHQSGGIRIEACQEPTESEVKNEQSNNRVI